MAGNGSSEATWPSIGAAASAHITPLPEPGAPQARTPAPAYPAVQNLAQRDPAESLAPLPPPPIEPVIAPAGATAPRPTPPVFIDHYLPPSASLPPRPSGPPPLSPPLHPNDFPPLPMMIFSDLYKSPKSPWSKLRQHALHPLEQPDQSSQQDQQQNPHTGIALLAERDYGDADLVSRDKSKQKDAVRRYLADKVRSDWSFDWPEQTTATAAAETAKARRLRAEQSSSPLEPSATFATPVSVPLSAAMAGLAIDDDDNEEAVESEADADDTDTESVYSTVSEDAEHFRARAEWTSDVSDGEGSPYIGSSAIPSLLHSPFRFDSPDSVGVVVKASAQARQAKVRKALREESAWNAGLACYTARRDAWTGARTVRIKPKPVHTAPTSPTSPRRSLFRFHSHTKSEPAPAVAVPAAAVAVGPAAASGSGSASTTPTSPTMATVAATVASTITATTTGSSYNNAATMPLSPVTSNSRHSQQSAGHDTVATTPLTSDGGGDGPVRTVSAPQAGCASFAPLTPADSAVSAASAPAHAATRHPEYAVETLLPLARPLLPAANPMRASIIPSMYLNLYDKVVLNSLQPSCPINLADMIRACVSGWKRDGEWPPRAAVDMSITPAAAAAAARRKRRDERRGSRKERRDSSGVTSGGGGGGGGGGFGRRMSNLFIGRQSATAAVLVPPKTAAAPADGTTAAVTVSGVTASQDNKDDEAGGSRGIRRSLQRVLGIGHGHHHTASVGSAGSPAKEGA